MGQLRSLDIELQTVTPLWSGGADSQPELRPPTMRGCFRFWLRALLGGVLGQEVAAVRAAESAVFGSTTRASTVAVRMSGSPQIGPCPVAPEAHPGVGYLYWSMFQRRREAILPNERFWLRIQSRPFSFVPVEVSGRVLDHDQCFALAAASAWLLFRLGGAGARGFRAGGGLAATAPPADWPESLPPLPSRAGSVAELAGELGEGIRRLRQLAGWSLDVPTDIASFDILHPNVCQLLLVDRTFPTWWEAVDWAGQLFQQFRHECTQDAGGVAALLTQGRTALHTIQRAVFGLPLSFFFKSMSKALIEQGADPRDARRRSSAGLSPRRGPMRRSPVLFRIVPLAGSPPAYAVLMGLFRARLLPDDQMTLRPHDRAIRPVELAAPADFSLVERWFDYVRDQGSPLAPVTFA